MGLVMPSITYPGPDAGSAQTPHAPCCAGSTAPGTPATCSWQRDAPQSQLQAVATMVATHEVGHFIGARHSGVTPAVMKSPLDYPTINGVEADDECAINDLYDHEHYPVTCD